MTRMSTVLLISSLAFAPIAEGRDDPTDRGSRPITAAPAVATDPDPCPNPMKLDNICMNISNRTRDPNPKGDYSYIYQRKIYDAACVDLQRDSDEEASRKIRQMWQASRDVLKCDSVQFDVLEGNVLKFAVSKMFNEVLEDAIFWRVDMNWVDPSDGRTVLDYVAYQIERFSGTSVVVTLEYYYRALRKAGAKHRSEL